MHELTTTQRTLAQTAAQSMFGLISSQGGLVQGNEPLIEPTQEMVGRIDISPHFFAAPAAAGEGPEAPSAVL